MEVDVSKEGQQFYWFVMDGRAKHTPDEAAVYEAIGDREPSKNYLRDWSGMDAALVRAPITSRDSDGNVQCGAMEFVRTIR